MKSTIISSNKGNEIIKISFDEKHNCNDIIVFNYEDLIVFINEKIEYPHILITIRYDKKFIDIIKKNPNSIFEDLYCISKHLPYRLKESSVLYHPISVVISSCKAKIMKIYNGPIVKMNSDGLYKFNFDGETLCVDSRDLYKIIFYGFTNNSNIKFNGKYIEFNVTPNKAYNIPINQINLISVLLFGNMKKDLLIGKNKLYDIDIESNIFCISAINEPSNRCLHFTVNKGIEAVLDLITGKEKELNGYISISNMITFNEQYKCILTLPIDKPHELCIKILGMEDITIIIDSGSSFYELIKNIIARMF